MENKEIELKFKISAEIKEKIENDLKQANITCKTSHIVDTYYIPNFKEFEINGVTHECVRIREKDNTSVLCYKKIHYESNPIYCDEYETVISNKKQMQNILFALGFNMQMEIDKIRTSYKLDKFKFDFDSVKNLGELLEVELIVGEDVSEIYEYVKKYGLTQENVTYEGIQILMKKALKLN